MAIAIATTAESTVVGTTLNATAPTGIQVGDLLIAQSGVNNTSSSVTAPAGWSTANFQQSPGGGSSGSNVYIQYKIAVFANLQILFSGLPTIATGPSVCPGVTPSIPTWNCN